MVPDVRGARRASLRDKGARRVVTVTGIDLRNCGQIVAIRTRGRDRQAIFLANPPMPSTKPAGTDWIEAYKF